MFDIWAEIGRYLTLAAVLPNWSTVNAITKTKQDSNVLTIIQNSWMQCQFWPSRHT